MSVLLSVLITFHYIFGVSYDFPAGSHDIFHYQPLIVYMHTALWTKWAGAWAEVLTKAARQYKCTLLLLLLGCIREFPPTCISTYPHPYQQCPSTAKPRSPSWCLARLSSYWREGVWDGTMALQGQVPCWVQWKHQAAFSVTSFTQCPKHVGIRILSLCPLKLRPRL